MRLAWLFCVGDKLFAFKPVLSFRLWETLYGVAQGGAGHSAVILLKKGAEKGVVFLAELAENPAGGFMHKVVGMGEHNFGQAERGGEDACADEIEGGHHGNTLFPKVFARGEGVKDSEFLRPGKADIWPEDILAGKIDEIPVVGSGGMAEVEFG